MIGRLIFAWLIVYPIAFVLVLPYVSVLSLFSKESYWTAFTQNLDFYFRRVKDFIDYLSF